VLHDKNGTAVAETHGGFLLPLLAGLIGPLLGKLFGSGTGSGIKHISYDGQMIPLMSTLPKEMKDQIKMIFKQVGSGTGSGTGSGFQFGEISQPRGGMCYTPGLLGHPQAVPLMAAGVKKSPKKKGGFAVNQNTSHEYSGFGLGSAKGPFFPVNLA